MNAFFAGLIALVLAAATARAQSSTPALTLSIDQQNTLSEIVTNKTPNSLAPSDFTVAIWHNCARDRVPANVAARCRGAGAAVCEERVISPLKKLVAVVDTNSRKIVAVMQRMRRQD